MTPHSVTSQSDKLEPQPAILSSFFLIFTVDLVIFTCLNFREFFILGLFKFRIREFSFSFSRAIIIIIFAIFLNSRIRSPREIREN